MTHTSELSGGISGLQSGSVREKRTSLLDKNRRRSDHQSERPEDSGRAASTIFKCARSAIRSRSTTLPASSCPPQPRPTSDRSDQRGPF